MSSVFQQLAQAKTRRDFLHPETISRHLYCSICRDVFEDPVRTICG
jgi:E3 ubiquitin-protein ligase NRDP1